MPSSSSQAVSRSFGALTGPQLASQASLRAQTEASQASLRAQTAHDELNMKEANVMAILGDVAAQLSTQVFLPVSGAKGRRVPAAEIDWQQTDANTREFEPVKKTRRKRKPSLPIVVKDDSKIHRKARAKSLVGDVESAGDFVHLQAGGQRPSAITPAELFALGRTAETDQSAEQLDRFRAFSLGIAENVVPSSNVMADFPKARRRNVDVLVPGAGFVANLLRSVFYVQHDNDDVPPAREHQLSRYLRQFRDDRFGSC
jgi:hypothetical protein